LADFTAELSLRPTEEEDSQWTLHVDDFFNNGSYGVGVVLERPDDVLIGQPMKFEFKTSNNQVEYEAIIADLNLTLDLEVKSLYIKVTSN